MQQPPGYPPGPPGYPPAPPGGGGYGPPPGGGYGPPMGGGGPQYPYGAPPPPPGAAPPPKQGLSTAAIVLIVLGSLCVLGFGGCGLCVCLGVKGAQQADDQDEADRKHSRYVAVTQLLGDYRANEIRADQTYKGKWITVQGGQVDEVRSGSVLVGTGKLLEIPEVQCMLKSDQLGKAASLKKGGRITVRGKVQMLLVHVLIQDCEIL